MREYAISSYSRAGYLENLIMIGNVPYLEQDFWSVVKKMNTWLSEEKLTFRQKSSFLTY